MVVLASPAEIRLELMSFEEVSAALSQGLSTVVIPCGAVEQHGPHLPLCMDADHADALAARVARRLGKALIAPTIKVGCSAHHLVFPGTISLRPETFEAICLDYCTSLAQHGFRRILLFSGHLGNCPMLRNMLPRLRRQVSQDVEIEAFVDSIAWIDTWRRAVAEAGGDPRAVGGHADIAETSLMMCLRPDSVRRGRFEAGRLGELAEEQLQSIWKNGIRSVSENGILGDPRGSTVQIGERCLEAIASLLANAFGK